MSQADEVYSFVFKGLLTEEALDGAGRKKRPTDIVDVDGLAQLVGYDALDPELLANARRMAVVYSAIAAFENSVRQLITRTLLEEVGENWWQDCVSNNIRSAATTRLEEEEKVKWHSQRGNDPIQYTMLPNLLNIIRQNFEHFEPFIHNLDWAANIFDIVERSRNVTMHSGTLGDRDIARIGSLLRDWYSQVSY